MTTQEIIEQAIIRPATKALVLRRSYRAARFESDEHRLKLLENNAIFNSADMCFRFPNGSQVWFNFIGDDNDKYKFYGCRFEHIDFDELDPELVTALTAHCLRLKK